MIKLAIVIPFYKISFFKEVLDSLLAQRNRNFRIYVGDDCSPESPENIINNYKKSLNIYYKRFDKRIGDKSLVEQWHRCFNLINDEEWVWFLPDDDLPSPNCVEEFYKALCQIPNLYDVNVFKIPLCIIDSKNEIVEKHSTSPLIQNNYEFYLDILKGVRGLSLGDNIFRKQSLIDAGGFVDLPKAWGSDHATVLKVTAGKKICWLQHAWFGFRQSGINISSQLNDGDKKMIARLIFAQWLKTNESIFPQKPSDEFYRYFYWKGEIYFLHHWKFSLRSLFALYRLRVVCFNKYNPLPLLKLMAYKLRSQLSDLN